jgi:hypothetical protein
MDVYWSGMAGQCEFPSNVVIKQYHRLKAIVECQDTDRVTH